MITTFLLFEPDGLWTIIRLWTLDDLVILRLSIEIFTPHFPAGGPNIFAMICIDWMLRTKW